MTRRSDFPRVPGTAAEVRTLYREALDEIAGSANCDPRKVLESVHADIRRRILGRRLAERDGRHGRRVTVSESLLGISDQALHDALLEVDGP